MSLPTFVILKPFFRSVNYTALNDSTIADFECVICDGRLGFGVPLVSDKMPYVHLSCYLSAVCGECGITTVNYIEHASSGGYRCAEFFACSRRKDAAELAERIS